MQPTTILHADEGYNGRTVKLTVGQSLEISLTENPTTGYRWQLQMTTKNSVKHERHCALLDVQDSYEPGNSGAAGQGGVHRWQLQALEVGTCKIELEYRRSWEQNKPPERTFRIQVEIRKGVQDKKTARPGE